jgi:hypothetical protein
MTLLLDTLLQPAFLTQPCMPHIRCVCDCVSVCVCVQTEKNCKKLREMLDSLSEAMYELEEAVNQKNPAVFAEVCVCLCGVCVPCTYLNACVTCVCMRAHVRRYSCVVCIHTHNPTHTHTQVSSEETEQAVAVQKRMKTLKKICRARAETRWYERDR